LFPTFYVPAFRSVIDAWKSSIRRKEQNFNDEEVNDQVTLFVRRWLLPFIPRIDYPSLIEIEQSLVRSSEQSFYIQNYLTSLNRYLDGKKVVINNDPENSQETIVELIYDDGFRSKRLAALSSGERQIAILFYATNQARDEEIILIDEPEISLHVDWQRSLVEDIAKHRQNHQIIACTHSPVIGADEDHRVELNVEPSSVNDF
jgi:ABC-type lipoprotein export system ATPase subunit